MKGLNMKNLAFRGLPIVLLGTSLGIIYLLLSGCATMEVEMTAKDKAAWAMALYNAQYDDYLRMTGMGNLTEDQRQILRKKKAIMNELWPLLKLYAEYSKTGKIPTDLEQQVTDLINQLIAERGGG